MSYSFDKDFEYDDEDSCRNHRYTNPFSDDLFFRQRLVEEIADVELKRSDRERSHFFDGMGTGAFAGFCAYLTTYGMLQKYSGTFAEYVKTNPDLELVMVSVGGIAASVVGACIGAEIRDKLFEWKERRGKRLKQYDCRE